MRALVFGATFWRIFHDRQFQHPFDPASGLTLLRLLELRDTSRRQGRATALLPQDPAREPAALRRRRQRHAGRHRSGAQLGRQGHAVLRNRFHARARHHAGLHRRALRGRSRRDARGREEARRRSAADQSAQPRRAGHRPFGAGGRLRQHAARSPPTTRSSSSATANAMRSCAGARPRSAISRWCRRTPASSTR